MNKNAIPITIVACVAIVVTGLVSIFGEGQDQFFQFLAVTVFPTIASIMAYNKSHKAENVAEQAEVNSNGRLSHLIQVIENTTGERPQGYEDIDTRDGSNG